MRPVSMQSSARIKLIYFQFIDRQERKLHAHLSTVNDEKGPAKTRELAKKKVEALEKKLVIQKSRFVGDYESAYQEYQQQKRKMIQNEVEERIQFIKQRVQDEYPQIIEKYQKPQIYIVEGVIRRDIFVTLLFDEDFGITWSDKMQKLHPSKAGLTIEQYANQ